MSARGWRETLLPIAVLAAGVAACFRRFVFSGELRIADDTLAIHYPVLASVFAEVRGGHLPTWFPEILLGYPGTGSVEFHLFSPFHWPFLFFRPEAAVALRFLSIHLFSAVAMYALARHLGNGRGAAVVAGLIWATGPHAVFMLIEPMASATVPWMPVVLLFWDRAVRGREWPPFVVAGLAVGGALLGGHLQHVAWFGVFVAGYTAIVLLPDVPAELRTAALRRMALGGAAVLLLGIAVAAIELLPSYALYRDSIRVALDAHERLPRERTSWADTLRLLGATMFTLEKPSFSLEYARLGLVPLALALLGLGRGRAARGLLLLALGFLLLALGDVFPPSNWLIRAVPGNRFRFAERIGLLFSLAATLLAAQGADALLGSPRGGRRLLGLATLALVAGIPLWASADALRRQEVALGLVGLACVAAGASLREPRVRQACLGLAVLAMLVWSGRNVDAVMAMEGAVPLGRRGATEYPAGWLRALPRADEHGPTRLLCLACPRGNVARLTGHETPYGYVTLRPARVERLVYGRERVSQPEVDGEATLGRRQPLLDLLGIRYVAVRAPAAEHFEPAQLERSLSPVSAVDGLEILENRTRLPRSFFVGAAVPAVSAEEAWSRVTDPGFDARRTVVLEGAAAARHGEAAFVPARVTAGRSDAVEVVVEAPAAGWLVLLDRWAEGWTCTIEGRSAPVLRANYVFRAVAVEKGRSVLQFRYRDAALVRGTWLSGAALVVSVGLLVWARRRAPVR